MLFSKRKNDKKDQRFEEAMEMVDYLISQEPLNTKAGLAAQEAVLAATTFNMLLMAGLYDDFDSLEDLYYKRIRTAYKASDATKLTNLFYDVLKSSVEGYDVLMQIEKILPEENQLFFYTNMLSALIGMIQLDREEFSRLEPEGNVIGFMVEISKDAIADCNFVNNVQKIFSLAATIYNEFAKK